MSSLTARPAGVTAAFLFMQACMNLQGRALCASGGMILADLCQALQEHASCASMQAGMQGLLTLCIWSSRHKFTSAWHDSIAG